LRPSVLIADDHRLYAEAVRSLLSPAYDVVDIATNGHKLVELATRHKPNLIVTDLSMPVLSGLDAILALTKLDLDSKIIVLTMYKDVSLAVWAFRAGASAFVLKITMGNEFMDAMRSVQRSEFYLSPQFSCSMNTVLAEAVRCPSSGQTTNMTEHQRRILGFVDRDRL
jgi:DNA-binding NarL/FixJ family response regulator